MEPRERLGLHCVGESVEPLRQGRVYAQKPALRLRSCYWRPGTVHGGNEQQQQPAGHGGDLFRRGRWLLRTCVTILKTLLIIKNANAYGEDLTIYEDLLVIKSVFGSITDLSCAALARW